MSYPCCISGAMNERDPTESAGTPTHASHAGSHSGEARPLRRRRLVLSVGGAHGELVTRGGRWVLDNDSEVRVLEALLGASGTRARFWALAATLNAGLVEPRGVLRLNRLLSQIAAGWQPGEVCVVAVPDALLGAVAYSCASQQDHNLTRWLAWALSARLDANLVRGTMAGPGWESLYVPGRLHLRGFNRDTHWMSEMSKSFWDRLGTHRHQRLRAAAAASDPAAQPEVFDRLARDPDVFPESWDLAACNPRTPVETLRDLARPDDLPHALAWRVAQNRCAPPQLLEELANNADGVLRRVTAWNPALPSSALALMAGDESAEVRSAVAQAAATPRRALAGLAEDADVGVRSKVAANPATPWTALKALLADCRAEVRANAAANNKTPRALAAAQARDRAHRVRCAVAKRGGIGAEALANLAGDLDAAVRMAVAKNPQTPPTVLGALAEDPVSDVRAAVAANPHTPPDALKALAGDEYWTPKAGAAENPAMAAALLAVLAADENFNVRFFAAKNPATPLESLRALADDDRWEVRAGVALNAAAPPAILEALAADRNKEVRRYICENASTSQNLLDVLCGDRKYAVRAAAARALERRGQQPRRPNTAAPARDRSIRTRQQYDTKNGERR